MRTPQSHTALENPPSQSTLEDLRMPVQAKLAAAWTSFMFLCIYVDTSPSSSPAPSTKSWSAASGSSTSARRFDRLPRAHGDPDPHGRAVDDAARPGEPHARTSSWPRSPSPSRHSTRWASPGRTSTASASDSKCCSWPSSCAPPGPGHAAPHHRRPWQPASTTSHSARRSRRDCPPRARPSFARPTRGHGHLPQRSLLSTPSHPIPQNGPGHDRGTELTKRYGDTTAVHSLSFTIAPGTFTLPEAIASSRMSRRYFAERSIEPHGRAESSASVPHPARSMLKARSAGSMPSVLIALTEPCPGRPGDLDITRTPSCVEPGPD